MCNMRSDSKPQLKIVQAVAEVPLGPEPDGALLSSSGGRDCLLGWLKGAWLFPFKSTQGGPGGNCSDSCCDEPPAADALLWLDEAVLARELSAGLEFFLATCAGAAHCALLGATAAWPQAPLLEDLDCVFFPFPFCSSDGRLGKSSEWIEGPWCDPVSSHRTSSEEMHLKHGKGRYTSWGIKWSVPIRLKR